MFVAGAVVGYCVAYYYTDLLWVCGAASQLFAAVIVAPAVALIFGLLSTVLARAVVIFVMATVLGYAVVLVGWFAFAAVFDIGDREGSKGMTMIFIGAPAGGVMIGAIAAALLSRRAPQTT